LERDALLALDLKAGAPDRRAGVARAVAAAPKPCCARAPTSIAVSLAKPASSDANVKSARPIRNMHLLPWRSASCPPSSMKAASGRV
jgi:hypothetical protein